LTSAGGRSREEGVLGEVRGDVRVGPGVVRGRVRAVDEVDELVVVEVACRMRLSGAG
jgi:hypothetical protein